MDAASIAALLEERRPQVIRYAMRLCISPEDAQDATQEALIALSKHFSALRELAALSRWLFMAVRTHCTRLARRSLKYVLTEDAPPITLEGDSPEEQLVDRQLRHRLAAIVSEMPPDLRDAIIACDFRGETPRDAADALGTSEAALKSRLHRARLEAKKRLLASISRTSRRG